jgi:hypothetical protein
MHEVVALTHLATAVNYARKMLMKSAADVAED